MLIVMVVKKLLNLLKKMIKNDKNKNLNYLFFLDLIMASNMSHISSGIASNKLN